MASEKPNPDQTNAGGTESTGDSEAALQEELRREASEGKDAIGDSATNRNLSGSSTWETLPDDGAADDTTERDTPK